MMKLNDLTYEELGILTQIFNKNIDKSELEKYELFTLDIVGKAKIFLWGYKLLNNIKNTINVENIKKVINEELKLLEKDYYLTEECIFKIENNYFNENRFKKILENKFISNKEISELIDVLVVLSERSVQLKVSKLTGFIIEGTGKEEYDKIFKKESVKEVKEDSEVIEEEWKEI